MNITSNLTSIKNFISELPRANLGNLSGRVVTFIRDNGLLFGIAAGVSIAAFFYFRSKQTPIAPDDDEIKDGQIIGSRLNDYAPTDSLFEGIQRIYCGAAKMNIIGCPSEIAFLDCEIITFKNQFSKPVTVSNYTKHYVDMDNSKNLFLDGFFIKNVSQNLITLFSFNNRQDLICTLDNINFLPKTLIFLEKVNNGFVISWTANAEDFGRLPDENEKYKYNFMFSMTKIDAIIHRKKVVELLFMSHSNDTGSIFATIPWDILNHIVMSV